MKYIKKPVEIEAIQWNSKNTKKVRDFCNSGDGWNCGQTNPDNLEIYTLEGTMYASVNDYIIKGVNGEFYPCKPDIFEKTYEKTPTLEEVKKEWEEKGWKLTNYKREIEIEDTKSLSSISIDRKDKMFWCSHYLPFDLIKLLTKTFQALGWFE